MHHRDRAQETIRTQFQPIDGFRLLGATTVGKTGQTSPAIADSVKGALHAPSESGLGELPKNLKFYGLVPAYRAFADAIQGIASPIGPASERALTLHRAYDALEKSNRTKRWEAVNYRGVA